MERQPNTIYVASISYGKDSCAMLEAIKRLGYPLDRIISAQVWATDDIPADLPEMYEWKAKADEIIFAKYDIKVERVRVVGLDYDKQFYRKVKDSRASAINSSNWNNSHNLPVNEYYGFPVQKGAWCNSKLKIAALDCWKNNAIRQGFNIVQYIGIANDEPLRIERHKDKKGIVMPLVDIGWTEADCRAWCEQNGLLSPVYTHGTRDGCWFCHNQGVGQLRNLRKNHPDLWALLLKWDTDSPVTFHADGHTVHDFDKRFECEDKGWFKPDDSRFKWSWLKKPPARQMTIFDLENEK